MKDWQQSQRKFHNMETGIDILISRASYNKSQRVGERLLRLHYALPYILENGKLIKTEESNRPQQKSLDGMLYFSARVYLDQKPFDVVCLVKSHNSGNNYYQYSLHDMVI